MDLDRGAQRRALAVTSGWDPAVHGGYGWGGAPAASAATRRVPNLPVDDVPELPPGGYAAPPGSTGGFVRFRNLAPRTRAERRSLTDKEALEKSRLRERTGGHHRYSDPGHLIAAPGPESAAFVDEQQRFVTDVAASDKARREEDHARRAAELLRRREREAKREDDRWQRMAEDKEKERDRVERMRQLGSKARRNKGSEPYDLVTQAYADDPAGARLKHQDDVIRYRAAMRAQFLQQKARGADFDLLTGQSRSLIDLPDEPKPETGTFPMAMASTRGAGLSRVMARTHVLAAPGSARRGVISEALVADWVPTTGCLDDELVIEDGKGARVSPLHDVPTFARFRAIRHRFPTMFAGGRRPMIVNATTIGQRKSDSLLQVDVEKEGNPIRRTLAPMGNPDRLTVPCESDCLAIGQTIQPTLWQASARAFGEAELDAFATIKGYAGGAYEAAASLDDAAESVRQAWEQDEEAVSSEPAASAAYPGYARQYGNEVAMDAAKIAEDWPARASAQDSAVMAGLDQDTADRLAARRAEAAAVAVARQRIQGATRAVEEAAAMASSFEDRGEDIVEAGAYGTAEAWRWGGGRMGSTGGPLTMLDLGMAASEPGTVRELAVLGAVAVLRATPCPLLNGDAPAPRNPLETWPAGADTFASRAMGRPADELPTMTLDWVILGAGLPAFESGSSSADLDAKAIKRSGLGSQATADELLNDDNGAAIRDVLLADLESGAHDLASLYDPQEIVGGSPAPSWNPHDADAAAAAVAAAKELAAEEGAVSASEAAAHAAATAATRRTDRLLLQARVEALSQWLESCTLGLDHVAPCTVVRGPNGRPLVFGAAVAQALVFAHRAAWWRHAVARPFFTQDDSPATGMDAILSLALPGANTPQHPTEGGWHPRTLTEPSPVAAAAALASLNANESSRDLFGSASQRLNDHSFLGSTDKGLFPRDPALANVGPLGAGGIALDDMCIDRFVPAGSEPLEAWQEEAFTATLRKRMNKARLMEERPEPTIGHHDE